MKSMTGFGRNTNVVNGVKCTVEIKSVNSRFLDINFRSPKELNRIEHVLRNVLKDIIYRGKLDISITLENRWEGTKNFIINRALKEEIQYILMEEGFYESPKDVPLQDVLSISTDWIQYNEKSFDEDIVDGIVINTTRVALENLLHMRAEEGEHIKADLLRRLSEMELLIQYIENHKDDSIAKYKLSIEEKLTTLLASKDMTISEERILQEIALLADKTDITEEIVRFRSHVVQLKNTLMQDEPIGRKLDFIIQEMNREVNTIGSKAMNLTITDRVVQLKCELEKIREQVQNIE